MKISIAMTVYNGEKYLYEQLVSLNNQTRRADEVIICDDLSSDKSIEIIERFISENNLNKNWKIIKNESNKGYNKNFLDCASLTSGDIIFFCDQDDIWHPKKIEEMESVYKNNREVRALSCTYELIDKNGEKINSNYNKLTVNKFKNNKLERMKFSKQIRNNSSCGMILSIRRDEFKRVYPIIKKYNMNFDLPIGAIASAVGGYFILYKPLAYRRIHGNNTSSPKNTIKERIENISYHIEGREKRLYNMKVYSEVLKNDLSKKDLENLQKAIKILESSIYSIKQRKLIVLFKNLIVINPMENKIISIVNLLCVLFGKYQYLESEKK